MKLKSIQGWLNLMPYCPLPSLELGFQLSALEICICQLQENKLAKLIHRLQALSSCTSLGQGERTNEEEENIRLKEAGNKRCLRNKPKYVQKC